MADNVSSIIMLPVLPVPLMMPRMSVARVRGAGQQTKGYREDGAKFHLGVPCYLTPDHGTGAMDCQEEISPSIISSLLILASSLPAP